MKSRIFTRHIDSDSGLSRSEREAEAVRALVSEAFGPDAVKDNLPSGQPIISINGKKIYKSISISHCASLAVLAIADEEQIIGVDVEIYRGQLRRVIHKFLTPDEEIFYSSDSLLLKAWTLKEATYKAALTPGLALTDIRLPLDNDSLITTAPEMEFEILKSTFIEDNVMLSLVARR